MDEMPIVIMIRNFAQSQPKGIPFGPTPDITVQEAEKELGFALPRLLCICYLTIGNGGFGPGFGIIGLKGGYASDYGNLVETYAILHQTLCEGWQSLEKGVTALETESRIPLPFCDFGGNMFACVDAHDVHHTVYSLEQGTLWREKYNLQQFFQMWMDGIDYSSQQEGIEIVQREYINPFTGKKDINERGIDGGNEVRSRYPKTQTSANWFRGGLCLPAKMADGNGIDQQADFGKWMQPGTRSGAGFQLCAPRSCALRPGSTTLRLLVVGSSASGVRPTVLGKLLLLG